jgi:nucleotide-binding universal stress UspA family protein
VATIATPTLDRRDDGSNGWRASVRNILVGIDGSPASLDALSWARGIAFAEGAALVVASVVEHPGPAVATAPTAAAAWCRDPAGSVDAELLLLEGRPGPALVEAARSVAADLVVVGTGGPRSHDDPLQGSVADYVSRHVASPFLAVPSGHPWRRPDRVVAALDGSAESLAAVDLLATLRSCAEAQVTALYGCRPLTGWDAGATTSPGAEAQAGPEGALRRRFAVHELSCWSAPLATRRLQNVVAEEADPAAAVEAVARTDDVDLVVAGMQGTSRLTGTRPGRTAFRLLHSTAWATLLVPPPGERDA